MSRPRIYDGVSVESVLTRMIPGKTYPAHVIAAKFGVPTATVRPMLDELLKRGDIETSHAQPKVRGFRKPRGADDEPVPEPPKVETSIATAPVHVRLDGTLTGYDSEIARRVALCMMVRTR